LVHIFSDASHLFTYAMFLRVSWLFHLVMCIFKQ